MRILHIVPTYIPAYRYGGPIESVHALNKALVELGDEVTVLTTNSDGNKTLDVPLEKPVYIDGVRVFYFSTSFPHSWFYSPQMKQYAYSIAKEYDVIHETSVFLYSSFLARKLAKYFKKPFIISPRGSLMREPLKRKSAIKKKFYLSYIEKTNLLLADAIHFTAEREKAEYIAEDFPFKKAFIIENSITSEISESHISLRKKLGIAEEKKIILSLGRLNWKKGFDTLIPAFKKVYEKFPSALLIIAGEDDGYKSEIERFIAKEKIEHAVIFVGSLYGEEKEAMYRESDVFVLPSYSENFGMAVAEAMRAGIPVVITPEVAIAEDVRKSNAGKIVAKKAEFFAEAISDILNNSEEARKMGENGQRMIKEHYNPGVIAEKMHLAYNEIMKREL